VRIGFVSRAFPACPEKSVHGIFKRMGMFIEAMKHLGELHMLFYVNPDFPADARYTVEAEAKLARHWDADLKLTLCNMAQWERPGGRWQEYIRPALSIADQPPYQQTAQEEQIRAFRRMLSAGPDILFVHRLSAMTPVLLSREDVPPTYFDLDDIEHVAFARSINQPPFWRGKPLQYLRIPVLRAWERRAIQLSRRTFVCSEHDRRHLSRAYGCENVDVIPNGVDIPRGERQSTERNLLFLGTMSYLPNQTAADHLIRNIWPHVLSALPDARLIIAGNYPDRIPAYAESPAGVEFHGFADDLDRLYARAAVVCCPILAGGGTRIKILEAAAFGKPVVSTTVGAEGIDLKDGKEIVLRDDPRSFADACVLLLEDRAGAARIGTAARSAVRLTYDARKIVETIRTYLDETTCRDRPAKAFPGEVGARA
jgi:glycosyltransferase involved in cell wall biosynthesis